ncbi:MAG: hypothetical protein PWP31_153 [Clostridia bacterium]|nr:hypothetical protein [Clostridia bacterium]
MLLRQYIIEIFHDGILTIASNSNRQKDKIKPALIGRVIEKIIKSTLERQGIIQFQFLR